MLAIRISSQPYDGIIQFSQMNRLRLTALQSHKLGGFTDVKKIHETLRYTRNLVWYASVRLKDNFLLLSSHAVPGMYLDILTTGKLTLQVTNRSIWNCYKNTVLFNKMRRWQLPGDMATDLSCPTGHILPVYVGRRAATFVEAFCTGKEMYWCLWRQPSRFINQRLEIKELPPPTTLLQTEE